MGGVRARARLRRPPPPVDRARQRGVRPGRTGAGDGEDPARAYLAGAGVMARLGTALGWRHYSAGWHATCTAGAPAAAVAAALARGLDAEATARAIALAVPAAGGVQRAFGTAAKSLQVAFAADAGVRAAALAEIGASADPRTLEQWMALVGGDTAAVDFSGPAVPGGLAIKLFPCCYALQRPIAAVRRLGAPSRRGRGSPHPRANDGHVAGPVDPPLPATGLEGKFSLEYGIAAALLDGSPGFESFSDGAVQRPEAVRLARAVEVTATDGGDHLLTGEVEIEIRTVCAPCSRCRPARPTARLPTTSSGQSSSCAGPAISRSCRWARPRRSSAQDQISARRPRAAPATWPAGRAGKRSTCPRGRRGRRPCRPDQAECERGAVLAERVGVRSIVNPGLGWLGVGLSPLSAAPAAGVVRRWRSTRSP